MVQIVFIRHGEKDRTQPSPHLDHKGKLRAKYLADYFLRLEKWENRAKNSMKDHCMVLPSILCPQFLSTISKPS